MPGWRKPDAQKAYDDLKEIRDACKNTIADAGLTSLEITSSDAETKDAKAKAAYKCLINMLNAAKNRIQKGRIDQRNGEDLIFMCSPRFADGHHFKRGQQLKSVAVSESQATG